MLDLNANRSSHVHLVAVPEHHAPLLNLLTSLQRPRVVLGLLAAAGLAVVANPVLAADWPQWLGVGLLVAAVVAIFVFPPAVVPLVILATAVFVVSLIAGVGSTFGQPPVAALPKPTAPLPMDISPLPIPLPGDASDALVSIGNNALAAANTLNAHASQGTGNLGQDLAAFSLAMAPAGDAFDALIASQGLPAMLLAQADVDATLAALVSGPPPLIADALHNLGLTPSQIQALADSMLATDLRLAAPTVSVRQVIDAVAGLRLVPEPGSHGLVGIGLLAALAATASSARRSAARA